MYSILALSDKLLFILLHVANRPELVFNGIQIQKCHTSMHLDENIHKIHRHKCHVKVRYERYYMQSTQFA